MIAPQTDVYLLKVPLEISNDNQLTFANATDQYNYFNSLTKIELDNFTYQRKDGVIRVGLPFDELLQYNYVMYRNEAHSNKWFYAFVTSMEYLNDNTTSVAIKTDVWQTWQFNITSKAVFVEREHTNNDTIGSNTVPEGLEYGEPVIAHTNYAALDEGEQGYCTVFSVSKLYANQALTGRSNAIGGVFNSLYNFACDSYGDAERVINFYNSTDGISGDDIQNIYLVPKFVVNTSINQAFQVSTTAGDNIVVHPIKNFATSSEKSIQQQNELYGGYVPINNKLYCYPYSYIYATNNNGENVELKWEDFKLERSAAGNYNVMTARYVKGYVPSSGVSAKLYFTNYKKNTGATYAEQTYSYGLNFGKIPVCAWTTDYYTNWLTQNGVNFSVSTATSLLSSASNFLTSPDIMSGTLGMANAVGGMLGTMQQIRNTPNQAKGDIATGDFNFAYTSNIIQFFHMTVRPEFARILDEFFSVYGYKTHRIKRPNITGRRNWNYVKTVGAYFTGDIPQDDMSEIKQLFDRGVTFWHNPQTFMDYSQNNAII